MSYKKQSKNETLIELFHNMLKSRCEDVISDKQMYDVTKLLCDLIGCQVPDSIVQYHHYWLKDYIQ